MSTPLLPTSIEVAQAWFRLVLPGVHVDEELPKLEDHPALATAGAVRITPVGGSPDLYVPMRSPVVTAECWVAATDKTRRRAWHLAGQLAERLVAATYDRALMGVLLDLPGDYRPARVFTASAVSEPDRVEDEDSGWARVDVDIALNWITT